MRSHAIYANYNYNHNYNFNNNINFIYMKDLRSFDL